MYDALFLRFEGARLDARGWSRGFFLAGLVGVPCRASFSFVLGFGVFCRVDSVGVMVDPSTIKKLKSAKNKGFLWGGWSLGY